MSKLSSAFAFFLALSAACGDAPPDIPDAGMKSFFPLAKGNRWTYRVTDKDGTIGRKTQTVTATTSVGGQAAFQLTTAKGSGLSKETVSIQLKVGTKLVRVEEEEYDGDVLLRRYRYNPPALRLDEGATATGSTYTDEYDKELISGSSAIPEPRTHTFTVEAESEAITVPFGTVTALRVRRQSGASTKTYWYARGIGKVKETGGQTEELESATVVEP